MPALIVAAGAGLRLYRLDGQSLSWDEAYQYFIVDAETSLEVVHRALLDAWPPLSHLINHAFFLFGRSDFILRLPCALFGIATLPLIYFFARKVSTRRVALFVLLVFTFSPFHIWYSQEARAYAQLLFLALLSTLLLIEALERGNSGWWIGYVLTVIAGLTTQVFMGFMVVAHFVWVLICHRRRLVAFGMSIAVILLPFIWLMPFFVRSYLVSIGTTDRTGFSLGEFAYTLFAFAGGFTIGPSTAELHVERSLNFLMNYWPSIFAVALVFGILLVCGGFALARQSGRQNLMLCLCGLLLPIACTALYSMGMRYNVRYAISSFPFFCVMLGAGLEYLHRQKKHVFASVALGYAVITALSLYNYSTNTYYGRPDVRSTASFWRNLQEQAPLLSNVKYSVMRYLNDEERERFFAIVSAANPVGDIENFFRSKKCTFVDVLVTRDWAGTIKRQIREGCRVRDERRFPGVILMRVEKSEGSVETLGAHALPE